MKFRIVVFKNYLYCVLLLQNNFFLSRLRRRLNSFKFIVFCVIFGKLSFIKHCVRVLEKLRKFIAILKILHRFLLRHFKFIFFDIFVSGE